MRAPPWLRGLRWQRLLLTLGLCVLFYIAASLFAASKAGEVYAVYRVWPPVAQKAGLRIIEPGLTTTTAQE